MLERLPTLIRDIPYNEQKNRSWTLEIDTGGGLKMVKNVRRMRLYNDSFGDLTYGKTPDGYDSWSFHQRGGGGAVTIPFAIINNQVYFGLIWQKRHNQGGFVWNSPGGFLGFGEKHDDAAKTQLIDETGFSADDRIFSLEGELANPNRAFFKTWVSGEGEKFYAIEVKAGELELEPEHKGAFCFKKELLKELPKTAEVIGKCVFFPWPFPVMVGDEYTIVVVARLLPYLVDLKVKDKWRRNS